MKIIKAVQKAIIENGILSVEALCNFCGISYKAAVQLWDEDGQARLVDAVTVLGSFGITLNEVIGNE